MDAVDADLMTFVVQALNACGCRADFAAEGVLRVRLSPEWVERWQCHSSQLFVFDRGALAHWPGARLIAPGSSWLDDLIDWARQQGETGGLFCPLGLDKEWVAHLAAIVQGRQRGQVPETLEPFAEALPSVGLANAQCRLQRFRLVYQRQLLFAFRVTFTADEQRQIIVPMVVDPVSEDISPFPSGMGWVLFPLRQAAGASSPYSLRRLYRCAQQSLPKALEREWAAFRAAVQERWERDRARIESYYDALISQELEPLRRWQYEWHRRALWLQALGDGHSREGSDGGGFPREYAERVHRWEAERERRLQELDERYRIRVAAELAYGAVVIVPRIEVEWRISHRRRRQLVTFFDVLQGQWVDWRCELCDRSLSSGRDGFPYVWQDGTIACADCSPVCGSCGGLLERGEEGAVCHLCHKPLCARCRVECSLSRAAGDQWETVVALALAVRPAPEHTVCPSCRSDWCALCVAMGTGGVPPAPVPFRWKPGDGKVRGRREQNVLAAIGRID